MNISLTPELQKFIGSKVQSGFYHSASEVVREGLRILAARDIAKNHQIEMLTAEIDKGLASLESDDVITDTQLMEHIQNRRNNY